MRPYPRYRERESNSHALRHRYLKPARLPISPSRLERGLLSQAVYSRFSGPACVSCRHLRRVQRSATNGQRWPLAEMKGLEPSTFCSTGSCSIRLSYTSSSSIFFPHMTGMAESLQIFIAMFTAISERNFMMHIKGFAVLFRSSSASLTNLIPFSYSFSCSLPSNSVIYRCATAPVRIIFSG